MIPESEALERAALEDLHRAATGSLRKSLGLQCIAGDSALVSVAAALPPTAIVINRVLGLGLTRPATADEIDAIVTTYAAASVPRFFVQLHPHARPAGIGEWLEMRGLEPARAWQKFIRGPGPVESRSSELEVREIGPEHGTAFGEIVCSAFDIGEAAVPWLARLPARPDWHVYMSFDGETPAGVGALFVRNGLGWLDFAATAPGFRRRGSQGQVQRARIELARALGCRRLYTCTGVAAPGDPQHSYRNILRAGFERDCVRGNYAPARST